MFDKDENLLYVGISRNWTNRFATHQEEKAWLPEVSVISLEWYSNRQNAALAERAVIRWEKPKYNRQSVVHNSDAWKHFCHITENKTHDDDFHKQLLCKIDDSLNGAPDFGLPGELLEWATLNALTDLSSSEEELIVDCGQCQQLGNTYWLQEGYDIICNAYVGRNK